MNAAETAVDIRPDKGFYTPGETVHLSISAAEGVHVIAHIMHLTDVVATLEAPIDAGSAVITWMPPATSPRGYGVDVQTLDAGGRVLAQAATAFDVLDHWTQAPRYGFLCDFTPDRADANATMAWAARHHVNGLQFYDWQYRHEQLLPPDGSDTYTDLLGRSMSGSVIRALIDAARAHNIAAMPYTAIYGASTDFYRQHEGWGLFSAPGKPYKFGGDYLRIMNSAPDSPWSRYLLDQFAQVLDQTAFDGIHIDQYGAPMRGWDAVGQRVQLDEAFPAFIDAAVGVVHDKRGENGAVIFNLVRNWPLATVAPSQQNAVYIEVWEPYRNLLDLHRIVVQAQRLSGGKPVIIAAYVSPEQEANVRLVNALITASGGYHLELGEPEVMLADPYFPEYVRMNAHMQQIMRRHYDFVVRYENVLALDTQDITAERASAVTLEGISTRGSQARDRVVVIARAGQHSETFSLVNLIGIEGEYWDAPITCAPQPHHNITVRVTVERAVSRIYAATPDSETAAPQLIEFTTSGDAVHFQLPQLDYWTMFVLEYAQGVPQS